MFCESVNGKSQVYYLILSVKQKMGPIKKYIKAASVLKKPVLSRQTENKFLFGSLIQLPE